MSDPNESTYHFAEGEDVQGPYGFTQMLELIAAGTARVDMLYSRDGAAWVEGYDCPELFPASAGAPPEPAPGPPPGPPSGSPSDEPLDPDPGRRRRLEPHRGGAILALGIVGLVGGALTCCVAICGIIAWVMANGDLAKMQAGTMDPAGEGQTRAGRVLGIITTVLLILGIVFVVIAVLVSPDYSPYDY